jgi:hypothetical protein
MRNYSLHESLQDHRVSDPDGQDPARGRGGQLAQPGQGGTEGFGVGRASLARQRL